MYRGRYSVLVGFLLITRLLHIECSFLRSSQVCSLPSPVEENSKKETKTGRFIVARKVCMLYHVYQGERSCFEPMRIY